MSGTSLITPPAGTRLIAGVMSGTSADGIDVAICELQPTSSPDWGGLAFFHGVPYSADLRGHIHELRSLGACTLEELALLTRQISLEHAAAVLVTLETARLRPANLTAIADHGQTVFHAPPLTMQLLDPALLAHETGVAVISDFRRADCAAGGQGAPLVPFADLRLFAHPTKCRALLNLGGIANVTLVHPGGRALGGGFDTGPANCLSDHLCRTRHPQGVGYDAGGSLACEGSAHEPTVAAFLREPYFRQAAPKSTDGPAMLAVLDKAGGAAFASLRLEDQLATVAECVARSVADAVLALTPTPDEVIASGGGLLNLAVVRSLTRLLGDVPLLSTDQLGIPSQAKEAIAFALLGNACLDNTPANIPACTGAGKPVVLGSVTPRP